MIQTKKGKIATGGAIVSLLALAAFAITRKSNRTKSHF